MLYIAVALLSLIVFLFCFYTFSRDDFYFLRKGVLMDNLFNVLFMGLFWGIVFGRITFIALHPDAKYLNPLVAILIPYFPGLSIIGGILGSFLAYIYMMKKRKLHIGRFLDYISLGLLMALPVGLFSNAVLQQPIDLVQGVYIPLAYVLVFIIFSKVLFPRFIRSKLREGTITLLFLILFTIITLAEDVVHLYRNEELLNIEDFVLIGVFIISSILMIALQTRKRT